MATSADYESKIQKLGWSGLRVLWQKIEKRDTPDWDPGMAFQYLVLRMFDLDGANVRWPYQVKSKEGTVLEEIDGSVQVNGLYALVESKNTEGDVSIEPIAKLRNQLLRRPSATIGLLFSRKAFTPPAVQLAQFTMPQAILLWTGPEVERSLEKESVARFFEQKYRWCVDTGSTDFDISTS